MLRGSSAHSINDRPSSFISQPGNFLDDMFKSCSRYGACVMLKKNHRTGPGAQLLIDNAKLISEQKMPMFDYKRDFCCVKIAPANEGATGHGVDITARKFHLTSHAFIWPIESAGM